MDALRFHRSDHRQERRAAGHRHGAGGRVLRGGQVPGGDGAADPEPGVAVCERKPLTGPAPGRLDKNIQVLKNRTVQIIQKMVYCGYPQRRTMKGAIV